MHQRAAKASGDNPGAFVIFGRIGFNEKMFSLFAGVIMGRFER